MTQSHYNALPPGTMLFEYRIESVLGQGGFGVTYKAIDTQLGRAVAIKEYYPREYCTRENNTSRVMAAGNADDYETFKWGLDRFLTEAKTLARFHNPSIVAIRRFFEFNNTAYIVMDFAEGRALDSVLKDRKTLPWDDIRKLLAPLLTGLIEIHKAGVLHRDIKPGNIYLRQDGSPILLDFGAATQEIVQHSRSVTSMASPGYGAFEQYSTHGKQGPYTDIYGLAATLYHVVAGKKPQEAPDRMLDDKLEPASIYCLGKYPKAFLNAIDEGLKLRPQDRPQSVELWRDQLFSETIVRSLPSEQITKSTNNSPSTSINQTKPSLSNGLNKETEGNSWKRVFKVFFIIFLIYLGVSFFLYNFSDVKQTSSVSNTAESANENVVPVESTETADSTATEAADYELAMSLNKGSVLRDAQLKSASQIRRELTTTNAFKVACPTDNNITWSKCVGEFSDKEETYVGDWIDNKRDGIGVIRFSEGQYYIGSFKNDKYEGFGKFFFDQGVYVGEFKDDKFNGVGSFFYANGSIYRGEFKDGRANGEGTITYAADGTSEYGVWLDDGVEMKKIR